MKKLIVLILMTSLLAGCVIDTSMAKSYVPDPNFKWKNDDVYVEVRTRAADRYNMSTLYTVYTTEEQAAYLKSGAKVFDVKLNDVPLQEAYYTISDVIETEKEDIYEIYFSIFPTFEEQEMLNGYITNLTISYKDKALIHYEHSPIYINYDLFMFDLVGGFKENENAPSGLGLKNTTSNTYNIQSLFVEDINKKRYTFDTRKQVFKPGDTILLSITKDLLAQQNLEGVIIVYALLENGEEQLLTQAPFTIDQYAENKLQQFIEAIENK